MSIGTPAIQQQDMFSPLPDPKRARLMAAIDKLNRDFGSGTVKLGAERLTEDWRMRQNQKSPCYTTRVSDIVRLR